MRHLPRRCWRAITIRGAPIRQRPFVNSICRLGRRARSRTTHDLFVPPSSVTPWKQAVPVKPTWFLTENVASPQLIEALKNDLGGITPIVINSALVSGQNRVRVYFTNIAHVCQPNDRGIRLSDVIGPYDYIWRYPRGNNNRTKLDDITKCPTLTTSNWKHNFKIMRSGTLLPFTAEQAETLQTLPVGYTASVSDKQRFRLLETPGH